MNLEPLYEEAIQFNNFNGTVLAAGKVEVWYLGRTRKADIYADVAGETPLPNPFDLNNLGMQQVYVNPAFNYTLVVYDQYGSELFSIDKYLQGAGVHTTSNVVVQPSENIGVSAWTVGEVQIYQPYLIGEVGKTYEGISPIVVNNDEDKISANHVALGVQEPLFFVQDDENACIIGCSAQTEIPSSVSSKWEDASDTVSNNSAQWGIGTVYTPGNYIDINDDVISVTGLQPAGDYAYNSAVSSKLDTTAFSTVSGNFLTTGDSAQFYTNDNPSGFITGVDLSDYATTGDLANKLDTTAFSNVSGDFITALPEDLVYTGDLNDYAKKDFVLSSIDSSTSGLLPTSSFSSVSGNFLTALPSDLVYTADITGLATTGDLANKLDTTAFSTVSGDFLTAHQDLSDYQTISGMTAYQEAGNYYSASNPSGFISEIPDELKLTALYIEGEIGPGQSEKEGVAITQTGINLYNELGETVNIDRNAIEKWDDTNNVLTANSAAWNEVSAKQPSGNYYSASNPSGFITGIPDDLTLTALNVTGIIESSESEQEGVIVSQTGIQLHNDIDGVEDISITAIQNWNSTNEIVSTNSATWDFVTDKLDTTAFSTISSTFLTAHQDLSDYQTTAGMTAYQPAGDYLTTADSAQFITALPADLVYTADITGFATTADLTSKLDKSDSAKFYTTANESGFITGIPDEVTEAASTVASNSANWNSTYNTVSTNSASWTASTIPSEVTAAASAVSSNSANWNSTYNTVSANSADWSVSEEISGINGIKISESADKVIIEVSASYATENWVTSQGYLTTETDWTNTITAASANAYNEATAAIPTGLATEDWVTGQGYITGINYNTGSI